MEHPLDDEEFAIVVTLTHGPTLTQTVGTAIAKADDGILVHDHVLRAAEQALDDMLERLENQGG